MEFACGHANAGRSTGGCAPCTAWAIQCYGCVKRRRPPMCSAAPAGTFSRRYGKNESRLSRYRRSRPQRRRLLALALLLIVSLSLGAALALQAIGTARRHRETAQRTLQDYAGFAAFILASQTYRQLGGEVVHTFTTWPASGISGRHTAGHGVRRLGPPSCSSRPASRFGSRARHSLRRTAPSSGTRCGQPCSSSRRSAGGSGSCGFPPRQHPWSLHHLLSGPRRRLRPPRLHRLPRWRWTRRSDGSC